MKYKRVYVLLLFPLLLILLAYLFFPVIASQLLILSILLVFDILLWNPFKQRIASNHKVLNIIFYAFYWLPFLMVIALMIYSVFLEIQYWNDILRTYLMGVIFIIYAAKTVPLIFLGIQKISRMLKSVFRFFYHRRQHKPLHQGSMISRSRFISYLGFIGGGAVLGGLFWGMFSNAYDFKVRKVKIPYSKNTGTFPGLTCVQISDIHLGSWTSKKQMQLAVDIINELKPDIIFFTGDLVNFSARETDGFRAYLGRLESSYGIYAVLGNHDYGDYAQWDTEYKKQADMQRLKSFFDACGWRLLQNESDVLDVNGIKIGILGIENWSISKRYPRYGDMEKTLKDMDKVDFTILLSHDPTHWEHEISKIYPDIDLTLSGHTHGMQFGIEIPGLIKWSPAKYIYNYWAGLYSKRHTLGRKQYLYVNRGLGNIGYPGRIGILPEITHLIIE